MTFFFPPHKCSKCGSVNSETFARGLYITGVRCLDCKYERIKDETPEQNAVIWSSETVATEEF